MQCEVSKAHIFRALAYKRLTSLLRSISVSPKGWTDQELGSAWLQRDFEPETAARNKTNGYRLLILDGHNSHTTYRFMTFAEKHKILILCLPSHTTHRLQPCDVGAFGPLAATWKSEVNKASSDWVPIRKSNLLDFYSRARKRAFTEDTIRSAFRKTGIYPLNRNAIERSAFAPALNTTTKAAMPVPVSVPDLLEPATSPSVTPSVTPSPSVITSPSTVTSEATSATSSTGSESGSDSGGDDEVKYIIRNVPKPLDQRASRDEYAAQNSELRLLLDRCCYQMQGDHALKKLMEKENQRLRTRLFEKGKKKSKKLTSGFARHMTGEECLNALARDEWESAMKEIFKDGVWKRQKEAYERHCKEQAEREKADERQKQKQRKDDERLRKENEKIRLREEKQRERVKLRDEAKLRKAAEAAAAKEKRAQQVRGRKKATTRATGPVRTTSLEDDSEANVVVRPRPRPRPVRTVVEGDGVIDVGADIRDPVRRSTRSRNTVDRS